MKTIAFAGGQAFLAQSWTIKKDHKVDFIFGTHRRKLSKTKSKNSLLTMRTLMNYLKN